ncbi:hypothetical protein Q1695_016163 [Nippostrongylus brasiliensis]|nr:hypothetical protein Q1695_016163 [Nippostrongylus brasiliensis]
MKCIHALLDKQTLSATSASSASGKKRSSSRSHRKTRIITTKTHVFKHNHLTYQTCFGTIHVKSATYFAGFNVLIVICCALFYCVYTSQEQRRPNLKLYALPMAAMIGCLLCLFVGIIQMKAKLFYPFIALQISAVFVTAIAMGMIAISVACNTKHILQHIVDVNAPEDQYKRTAVAMLSVLSFTLCLQLWYLRIVCNCFRYFTDLERFNRNEEEKLCV